MAIDYETQGTIQSDSIYRNRLRAATMAAALDISGEVQGGSSAEDWASRQALAHRVLKTGSAEQFEAPVLANIGAGSSTATDQSGITDGDLDTAIAAVWNDVAGIAAV